MAEVRDKGHELALRIMLVGGIVRGDIERTDQRDLLWPFRNERSKGQFKSVCDIDDFDTLKGVISGDIAINSVDRTKLAETAWKVWVKSVKLRGSEGRADVEDLKKYAKTRAGHWAGWLGFYRQQELVTEIIVRYCDEVLS